MKMLDGFILQKEDVEKYEKFRWWPGLTLGDLLDKAAISIPTRKLLQMSIAGSPMLRQGTKRTGWRLASWASASNRRTVFLFRCLTGTSSSSPILPCKRSEPLPSSFIDRYRQYEIGYLVQLTGATSWIVAEKYKKTDYLPIVEDVLKERPQLKNVILARSKGHGRLVSMENLIDKVRMDKADLRNLSERRPDPNQVAHMGPTGGTTGLPKVVPRTHNSIVCAVEYAARSWEMDIHDTTLLAGPIGHDLTFTKGLLGSLFALGKAVFLDSMEMTDVCQTIQRERATAIVWVPTLAKRLTDFEGRKDYDLSSLKRMHCGGGASLPDVIKGVREKLNCAFFNGYGGTEGQTTIPRSGDSLESLINTVGKPTCPYDTYKAVTPEGKELPPNQPGELMIKGPGVFTGYYRAPEENAKVFDEEGFFRTGDLARIDEKGYVTLTGRIKEMINRGGESISATEIEKLIIGHPDVSLVAVIPMPDPVMGERVCAYIQPKAGAKLSFEKIIAYLKERKALSSSS
jgi:non-ribosomal peptide synthetase component E (peptide arylation enzyme)